MKFEGIDARLSFLARGGEMGALTREKDWSETSMGQPEEWPQSLRIALGILLNSKFPMLLMWGPELINFYNDAFRPSLGKEGKHPSMLGMPAKKAWAEIWEIVSPLLNQVYSGGEAIWNEDQLIPIYRNGKIEDVYWTYSYSPIKDETGKTNGVFVTVAETTEKVITVRKLQESERKQRMTITQAPVAIGIFRGLNYITEVANARALELWGRKEEEVLNKPILEAMPELVPQGIKQLLDDVYNTGVTFSAAELPIQILRKGKLETVYVNFSYEALYAPDGTIDGVMTVGMDVTDHVSVRKKIEESEQRYRNLIYSSPSAIGILYGEDLIITIANGAILEIWGKGKEIIGKSYFEALPELAEQGYKQVFAEVYKTGIPFNAVETPVYIVQKGKMTLKYYNLLLYPQRNINGDVDGIGIIATEVTSHALLNKQIQENEKKFRLLADSLPQHIWTSDHEGNLNYYNQSLYNYSGLAPGQIGKDGLIEIVHPDDKERTIKAWKESTTTGKDFIFEHRFRQHDGVYRWQLSRAVPQRDADGKIQMWMGTSTDIQDQKTFTETLEKQVKERTKQLEQRNLDLKKSEERYHLMVQEVQDYAILYLNNEGVIENWNQGAEKIKGYNAKEIIGKNFSTFYTKDDRDKNLPQHLLGLAAKTGKAVQEGWRVRKDGSLFWASVVITAVHNEKGEIIGFSKVTHDLTGKKQADDELLQKNKDLEKMNKELESFAYISSHDLQEPLRKIQTFALRIKSKELENLSPEGKDSFERIQISANRMQTLINDLLAYSRTQATELNYVKSDLNAILKEVKEDLKEDILQKQAIIEAVELCALKVIPFQFRQLMQNLISNSLKFSNPGKQPHIKIKSEVAEGINFKHGQLADNRKYCHIIVSDNGIGFDPEYSEKIFGMFQRLHDKNKYNGTGIGLAIVKRIVENHNGIITAKGALNQGATFDIYIPA